MTSGAVMTWFVMLLCVSARADDGVRALMSRLERSQTGHRLADDARALSQAKGVEISDWIKLDDISRTDAVLTRVYYPATGREERTRDVVVYLRKDLASDDLILDLAHELTHATRGSSWDPYDPALTRQAYVDRAIAGPGGEADALIAECRVARELNIVTDQVPCHRYLKGESVDRESLIADFYKVGKHAVLFSSTGRAPYPVALSKEYDALMRTACQNTGRRLAEISKPRADLTTGRAEAFMRERCQVTSSAAPEVRP